MLSQKEIYRFAGIARPADTAHEKPIVIVLMRDDKTGEIRPVQKIALPTPLRTIDPGQPPRKP